MFYGSSSETTSVERIKLRGGSRQSDAVPSRTSAPSSRPLHTHTTRSRSNTNITDEIAQVFFFLALPGVLHRAREFYTSR